MAATGLTAPSEGSKTEPFTEQEPFLWNNHRYYGYLSGVGAGKTAAGVIRSVLNVELWNPGHMGAIVAPTSQMVKNAIIPLMRDFGLMDSWDYQGPQAEAPGIHTPNGSRIVVLSADNDKTIERLAALNLAWWWLDEARRTPSRARQILIQRLRKGNYTNGYITTTPNGHDHNYDFFVGDVETEQYQYGSASVYESDDRLAITAVPTDANPHITDADKKAIRDAHPHGLLEQEVEGQFVEVGSGLLNREMLSFVDLEDLPEHELSWYVGVDIGVESDARKAQDNDTDYWAAAAIAHDSMSNTAYLVDVTRRRGLSLQQGVGWLADILEGLPTTRVVAEANQAQRWFVQSATEAGLNVDPVTNTTNKEDRIIQLSVPFENEKVKIVDRPEVDWSDFVSEWVAFPNGRHDDQLDAVEMALSQISLGGSVQAYGGNAYGGA